ncbi:MAG TPA: hypothetical protein VD838_05245 [Anaeromyxobacteraceae bacterium]|nr:hypothetical protein [Anaeromyxobacteraceae bacterium]
MTATTNDDVGGGRSEVCVDFVTFDEANDEWAVYVVEDPPWPKDEEGWKARLSALQDRVLDIADAAIDGGVSARFPESRGRRVRIQVDSPTGTPERLQSFVEKLQRYLATDPTSSRAVQASSHVEGLRVLTGRQMGRFGGC